MLPAYAGMIRHAEAFGKVLGGAPRVCGDDPTGESHTEAQMLCSPRMRG